MNIDLKNIPQDVDKFTVIEAIAGVLHTPALLKTFSSTIERKNLDFKIVEGRKINFAVELAPNKAGGVGNDGTGVLTLPSFELGRIFLDPKHRGKLNVGGRLLRLSESRTRPAPAQVATLAKTPFVDPTKEKERQGVIEDLHGEIRVDAIQFGIFHREEKDDKALRRFSIEWYRTYVDSGDRAHTNNHKDPNAWLSFDYDSKLIIIKLGSGNHAGSEAGVRVAVSFTTIQKIAVGHDGKPYVCFDTLVPPVLEEIEFNRTLTGNKKVDNSKYKHRVGAINAGHHEVAPYAPYLRIVLTSVQRYGEDPIEQFRTRCNRAGIGATIVNLVGHRQILAENKGFFAAKKMIALHKRLAQYAWPVAFQLEALLHNGILHTGDMQVLLEKLAELKAEVGFSPIKRNPEANARTAALLIKYNQALRARGPTETPAACFERVLKDFKKSMFVVSKDFNCSHVTFTPTRMILEGPYPTQSNRIIRQFSGYEDHFIRVDFRDEDRLQYRWTGDVDGRSFLTLRVGGTLKNGFELAGRKFEFLAYSFSALRQHSVWFVNPFNYPGRGWIDGNTIRQAIGNFEGTALLRCPSKYAARLSQAFTATQSSVRIGPEEWAEVDDLVCPNKSYMFTDGIGSISQSLADRIWDVLKSEKRNVSNLIAPSAYQIRFLGYKGVVAIDKQLDSPGNKIQMRLRPSMRKFEVQESGDADIEIAEHFCYPNTPYFNRPLVMVMEDLNVRKEVFLELQDVAVADARTIDDSIQQFRKVVSDHHLGSSFRLREILHKLNVDLNMDITKAPGRPSMESPFFRRLRQVAVNNVLRDIKHRARIPIPNSFHLVGVVDEGPAYEKMGHQNVYCLGEGEIYVCIQKPGEEEPTWMQGSCCITRSPVTHPGDVQRVWAIGKPPDDVLCLFRHLKNVVVLNSRGDRSLASILAGGDVDGDLYSVIFEDLLQPSREEQAADYTSQGTYTLPRDSTIDDVCDFVVEYINSDVLGLLSDRLLTIADQSSDGIFDPDCKKLSQMCSQAVDYPKQGVAVDIDSNKLPRPLIRYKPDWHAAEAVSVRQADYYESNRALGHLFRRITLDTPDDVPSSEICAIPSKDAITQALCPKVQSYLQDAAYLAMQKPLNSPNIKLAEIFKRYQDELEYICTTHIITRTPGDRLLEEEVVIGTILAKCQERRSRSDRTYRMRTHSNTLVKEIEQALLEDSQQPLCGLENGWRAWNFSITKRVGEDGKPGFGAHSFGLIGLMLIFDCLEKLDNLT